MKDATAEGPQIQAWWSEWPEANVGIATGSLSGIVVVDVDGPQGEAALRTLNLHLPTTLEATTGRGRHLYFRATDGARSKVFGPNLSVRGDGYYVVAPPSVHVSGKQYPFTNGLTSITPAPVALLALLKTEAVQSITTTQEFTGGRIPKGKRKRTLLRNAMGMAKEGFSQADAEATQLHVNQELCDPPLWDRDVKRVVAKAFEYVASQPKSQNRAILSVLTEPVDSPTLVRNTEKFIRRYLILPPQAVLSLTLWALATHCFDLFDAFPYLTVTSPTPRCGKTRLLEVMELVVKDAMRATNASEAALFRGIEKFHPTLLLDEAEPLSSKGERAEYLRAVVNAGNRRGAYVLRCEGQPPSPEKFNVFCPKVIVQIGSPPTTVLDRSIVIPMQRRKPGEQIARFLMRTSGPEGVALQEAASNWCNMHRSDIQRCYEEQPLDTLTDRDAECWQPLFAILGVAHAARLPELKLCAEALTGSKAAVAEDDSLYLRLLADVWRLFESSGTDRLSSAVLTHQLLQDETAPWVEFDRGKALTQRGLARILGRFGVSPRAIRLDNGSTPRGYLREQFHEPWARYLTLPSPGSQVQQVQQPSNDASSESFSEVQQSPLVADEKTCPGPHKQQVVARVADQGEGDARAVFRHGGEVVARIKPKPNKWYRPEPLPSGGWRCECGVIIANPTEWSKHTGIGGCPLKVKT